MPLPPEVGNAEITTLFLLVCHQQDFRVSGEQLVFQDMYRQRAETTREGNLLFRCQVLIANGNHPVLQMCLADGLKSSIVGGAEISAIYLGKEAARHLGTYSEGHDVAPDHVSLS